MFNFFKYTEAKLAEEVISICRQIQPGEQFDYDVDAGCVRSSQHDIYLSNLFDQLKDKNRQERLKFIDNFLCSAIGEQTIDYDSSSHLLMPRVKSTAELHAWSQYLSLSSPNKFQFKPLTEHFVCMLGLDRSSTIHSVMSEDLEKMEMSFDEAFKHAIANLYQKSTPSFSEVSKGLYAADFQDGHNAARLMLIDQIENLKVNGDPVAFIPTNDELVICGSEDTHYFAELAKQCQELTKDTKPLSFDTLILKDGKWHDYYPPKTEKYAPIHNLHVVERASQYSDQQLQIEEKLIEQGLNQFVSPQSVFERDDNPFYFSVCTWMEDTHCLLPVSDQVHFIAQLDQERTGIIAVLSWQDTLMHFGDLMTPTGTVPERYEVSEFPDKAKLLQVIADKA